MQELRRMVCSFDGLRYEVRRGGGVEVPTVLHASSQRTSRANSLGNESCSRQATTTH